MLAIIEDAILARIAGAKLPYLRTLATYGGELDEGLGEAVRRFPAVWTAFKSEGEGVPLNTAKSVYRIPATWVVFVAARNLRNEAATRRGDKVKVGTYQMLKDVRALLAGQDFGLAIDNLRPGRVQSMVSAKYRGQGVSVYAQEWNTRYDYRVTERGTGAPLDATGQPVTPLPELSAIGFNYYLKPGDDVPDAVDLITLQQGRAEGSE
ncbi:DUF1834 family protein [Humidesulfovibrio idahonensis]